MAESLLARTCYVPEVALLDYDRTLAPVEPPSQRLGNILDALDLGVTSADIAAAQARIEAAKQSFLPLKYLSTEGGLDKASMDQVLNAFLWGDYGPSDFLYEDGVRFLDRMAGNSYDPGMLYFVMTAGDETSQHAKIACSGYTGGLVITAKKTKSEYAHLFHDSDEPEYPYKFRRVAAPLGRIAAASLCIVDDSPLAFENMPPHSHGYCINRLGKLTTAQLVSLPPNVKVISSLDEISPVRGRLVRTAEPVQPTNEPTNDIYSRLFDPSDARSILPNFDYEHWPVDLPYPTEMVLYYRSSGLRCRPGGL